MDNILDSSSKPTFPSLYNPAIEFVHIIHHGPEQPGGIYLTNSGDVYRFTLYWSLILSTPAFVACGIYAFFNLAFPAIRYKAVTHFNNMDSIKTDLTDARTPIPFSLSPTPDLTTRLLPREPVPTAPTEKKNPTRSRITFALLVLLTFLGASAASAVVGSAVLAYVLVGLFKAGTFQMSTWIPFIWALIQTFVGLLGSWPSTIDII